MFRITLFSFFVFIAVGQVRGQLSYERQAVARMQKGKWKAAEDVLRKSIRKDTLNPEAKYTFSKFFFLPQNPAYQIDSAYHYINQALTAWNGVSVKEKERLRRFPLDSGMLLAQRAQIDSAGFERAKKTHTEVAYQDFLTRFATATQRQRATELRDEVAFAEALKSNTWQSFAEFLNKYPRSERSAEAKKRYDQLLYEVSTKDGKLKSFQQFFQQHPESPFRQEADRQVFEIFTAPGTPDVFTEFMEHHPESGLVGRARVILYHLSKEEDLAIHLELTDSLRQVQHDEAGYWVPVLRNGKFGFMDHTGAEVVTPRFEKIQTEYICGNVRADHLVVGEGVISRSGHWIYHGVADEVVDLGSGYLKIYGRGCTRVFHKSGFVIPGDCLEDARMLGHQFIAIQRKGKWGLVSLAGRELLKPQCESITSVDGLIILGLNGKKVIVTVPQIAALAENNPLPLSLVFDDVQRIAYGNYRVHNGSLDGVLNEELKFVVPLDRQGITRVPDGFQLEKGGRFKITGQKELTQLEFSQVLYYGDWIRLSTPQSIQLYDWRQHRMLSSADSIWFDNKLAFARHGDSLRVYLATGAQLSFASDTRVTFMKSADSTAYFFVPEKGVRNEKGKASKNGKAVFSARSGTRMFAFDFDEADYLGNNSFLITRGGYRGLLSLAGKVLLPVEYEAIVPMGSGLLSLLRDKKFGAYQVTTQKLLKPAFDGNVNPVGGEWLAAFRDGGYGLIGWDGKPLGAFEYEEVRPWNDSSVLVRSDFQWMIYGIRSGKILRSKILDYTYIVDTPEEKLAIVHQDLRYGVISNRRGEIIPANFSDVVNVGSADQPLYFAEKSVEEAGIFVVIYYDSNGKLIRKQVYEEAEYEKIYCADN